MYYIPILAALIFCYARLFGARSVVFVFLSIQTIYYIPIIFLSINMDAPDKILISSIHAMYSISIIGFCFLFSVMAAGSEGSNVVKDSESGKITNLMIFFLCLLVCGFYYYMQGGLFFLRAGSYTDVALLRLSYYAVDNAGAGYVNQFKNILLPMTALALLMSVSARYRLALGFLIILIVAPLMIGTGQRFPIVYAAVVAMFVFYKLRMVKVDVRTLAFIGLTVVAYGFLSVSQARANNVSLEIIADLWERLFLDNQISSVRTFVYMMSRGLVYGSDWYQDILSISPSIKPSTINKELFGYLWGSSNRGNSPPSLPSSLYFNFGFPGIVMVAAINSWIITRIEYRHLRGTLRFSRYIAMVFIAFSISKWTSSTLLVPLNAGLLALLVYLFVIRIRWG